jgi:hypothetical protein
MTTNYCSSIPWVWKDSFNHHPAYPGIWVVYNGQRYKEYYDIRLKDGTVHRQCRPNGMSWGNDEVFNIMDRDIAEVCLLPATEHPHEDMTQQDIIDHCIYLYGEDDFPDVICAGDGIAFIPKQVRWFDSMVKDANGELVMGLMEGELTLEETLALQLPPGHNLDDRPDTTEPSS